MIGGLVSALIPLAFHFFMRGKPKKFDFPAIRFVRQKFETNQRHLNFKHFLLMTFRILIVVLLGLALSRPSLKQTDNRPIQSVLGQTIQSLGSQNAPIAAVIVFDNSVRMDYRINNKTRLEEAKEYSLRILSQLPRDSQIAILNSTSELDSFQIDFLAAKEKINQMTPVAQGRSILESVLEAVQLLQTSTLTRREMFILTDRSDVSWTNSIKKRFQQELEKTTLSEQSPIEFYLVDFGKENTQNTTILDLGLFAETISAGQTLRMDVGFFHEGSAINTIAELYLKNPHFVDLAQSDSGQSQNSDDSNRSVSSNANRSSDLASSDQAISDEPNFASFDSSDQKSLSIAIQNGTFQKIAAKPLSFPEGKSKQKSIFFLSGLKSGIYQGFVRLVNGDALELDNIRWFTISVHNGWKILTVSPFPVEKSSIFVKEALAPAELTKTGQSPFNVESISFEEFEQLSLSQLKNYQAIFLLDPNPFSEQTVHKLSDFAFSGGGIGFFMGRNAQPISAFQTPEMISLLGGKLTTQVRLANEKLYIHPEHYNNPILLSFRLFSDENRIPWDSIPIYKYWFIKDLSETSTIIADYNDGRPALISHPFGRGSVIVLTTPVSDSTDNSPWNLLPIGDSSWVFLVLIDGIARNLISGGGTIFNYFPNEIAILRQNINNFPSTCQLILPDQTNVQLPTDIENRQVSFSGTKQIGLYQLESTDSNADDAKGLNEVFQSGFSVNYRSSEFNLDQKSREEVDEFWTENKPIWLDQAEKIDIERSNAQKGRDLFPFLIILLVCIFVCETFLANRFYRA